MEGEGPPLVPRWRRLLRAAGRVVLGALLAVLTLWAALAIFYSPLPGPLRALLALAYGAGAVAAVCGIRPRRNAALVLAAAFLVVLVAWQLVRPSHDRDWTAAVAVMPRVTLDGDRFTIHNVRNFTYLDAERFEPHYEDRTYDLGSLRSVDFIVSYFSAVKGIAHTYLSFGFPGDDYLCVSIEARREKGESYAPLPGMYKHFELIYVVGDERDLIGSRTYARDEELYLYRLHGSPEKAQVLLRDYLRRIERLAERPEFYHTITSNCTTNIMRHANTYPPYRAYNWRILLNGFTDRYVYDIGALDTSVPFAELKARAYISERARAAYGSPDFSARIREGLVPSRSDS